MVILISWSFNYLVISPYESFGFTPLTITVGKIWGKFGLKIRIEFRQMLRCSMFLIGNMLFQSALTPQITEIQQITVNGSVTTPKYVSLSLNALEVKRPSWF